jgi:hypothetical protein
MRASALCSRCGPAIALSPANRRHPPTSCAHRLGKPDRTSETSDALCRPTLPRKRAPHPYLAGSSRGDLEEETLSHAVEKTPHSGPRRARLAVLAAGLERRAANEPGRLPSVRPRNSRPFDPDFEAGNVAVVNHSRSAASHPLARAELLRPRQRLVARLGPSLGLFSRESPRVRPVVEKDAPLRLLQPTHDTSTLHAARFPLTASASLGPRRLATAWPPFDRCSPRSACIGPLGFCSAFPCRRIAGWSLA